MLANSFDDIKYSIEYATFKVPYQPVRKIKNRGLLITGCFPSIKMDRIVHWEAQNEWNLLYYLEMNPLVKEYWEQPLRIKYFFNGKEHHYTPDLLIKTITAERDLVIEVKPASKLQKESLSYFEIIKWICDLNNLEFRIITDAEIRVQPKLDNVRLLYYYAKSPVTPQHIDLCKTIFSNDQKMLFVDVAKMFMEHGFTINSLYALMFRNIIEVDLMKPINDNCLLSLSKEEFGRNG